MEVELELGVSKACLAKAAQNKKEIPKSLLCYKLSIVSPEPSSIVGQFKDQRVIHEAGSIWPTLS